MNERICLKMFFHVSICSHAEALSNTATRKVPHSCIIPQTLLIIIVSHMLDGGIKLRSEVQDAAPEFQTLANDVS